LVDGRYAFSEHQANQILELRLYQLTGLEREKITAEYQELIKTIQDLRDILAKEARVFQIIKKELPIDILEFFCLTPLPGSEDHKVLWQKGVWMDPDMNKYDLNHRVSHHSKMPDTEWEEAYRAAWAAFYTPRRFLELSTAPLLCVKYMS